MKEAAKPRVLLVRLSSLGDVVLATAALEALREDVPSAEVHVLTKRAFADVFENHPGVSRVIPWEAGEGVWHAARRVAPGGYDWVVDLHRSLRTLGLRFLLRTARWTGYRKGILVRRLAVRLRRPRLLGGVHVVDRYIAALRPLGVTPRRRLPKLYPTVGDREAMTRRLAGAGWDGSTPLVALAPGARWKTKAWPQERWTALLSALGRECFPVLLGGSEEVELCAEILGRAGVPGANLAGRTRVAETAAVLEAARVLVSNDSAPLHLAGAVGTPVIAFFGPTVRGFGFYPLGPRDVVIERDLPCRPCSLHGNDACPLGHHECLKGIGVEDVARQVRQFLDATESRRREGRDGTSASALR